MNELGILMKIEQQLERFSPAEKKVAAYILEHAELVPNMTTKELAQASDTSEASVVRFCKTVGIGSFPGLKLALVRELTTADMSINDFSILDKPVSPHELFVKVTYVNKAAIEAVTTTLDKRELEKAAEAIMKAKKLLFYGVGGSAAAAMDASYKFTKLGYMAVMSPDFHTMLPLVAHLNEGDVFVAISTSGRTKDVLEIARFAKKQHATVIAITKLDPTSPLYKEADIKLALPDVEQDHRIGSMASRMVQLNVIDALYLITFHRVGSRVIERFHQTREEVVRLRR
ncbi:MULTISPECIES: MurR/RpiR family transcriptional regulator [Geobacillus]|uniref:SIS domain protein n=1 Tax=Geobacillus kaustophilus TaxID=1462 RepID=A0A0D8BXB0_GEOKU|nr:MULTISPECIES: MurR/RpiR family transcriptional regulator [Geobacillus]KAF0995303.1 HTH-type transcriptional regulator HexR [Geobacillus sp. TFV-3]KJE28755.1 SIS domain protein [Geobacillus kaustophilus]